MVCENIKDLNGWHQLVGYIQTAKTCHFCFSIPLLNTHSQLPQKRKDIGCWVRSSSSLSTPPGSPWTGGRALRTTRASLRLWRRPCMPRRRCHARPERTRSSARLGNAQDSRGTSSFRGCRDRPRNGWVSPLRKPVGAKEHSFRDQKKMRNISFKTPYLPHQWVVVVSLHFACVDDLAAEWSVSGPFRNARSFAKDAVVKDTSYPCLAQSKLYRGEIW